MDVAGGFATKLLAMSGLRVVRPVLAPTARRGSTRPELLRIYLDAGKEMMVSRAGRPVRELVDGDDVVFSTFDRGPGAGPLRVSGLDRLPGTCVHVETSSFGSSGPYSRWRGGPLAEWAAGGYLAITGQPGSPPLIGPENLCGYAAGYTAAIAAEAALLQRQTTGEGQRVDVGTMESMLSLHQSTFSRLAVGVVRERTGRYTEVYPLVVRPCRDGHVSLGVVTDAEFDRLAIAIGRDDLVVDDRFVDARARWEHRDALDAELDVFLGERDADQVVAVLRSQGVASAKVVGPVGLLGNPQLAHRAFWHDVDLEAGSARMPGNPLPPATRFAKRRCGPGSTGRSDGLPLSGVTVVDFTSFWAGPLATRWLADLGARVIWVERPGSRAEPDWDTADVTARVMSVFHLKMNRNKESVVLDLTTEHGRELARRLAAESDVLVENFRPGVMAQLGLGPSQLCGDNPRLVYVSLSGFGSVGPWSTLRSYGPTIEAASSIEGRTGYPGGEPMRLGHTLPDGTGGLAGALAALRGLRERSGDGRGGWFDISQLEVYAAISGEDILSASLTGADPQRIGNRSREGAIQGVFPCKGDDEWVAVRLRDRSELEALSDVLGLPEIASAAGGAERDTDRIEHLIGSCTMLHDKHSVAARLQAGGLEAFPVLGPPELVADAHLLERGFFVTARLRGHDLVLPGTPLHSDHDLVDPRGPAPPLGGHTDAILGSLVSRGPS